MLLSLVVLTSGLRHIIISHINYFMFLVDEITFLLNIIDETSKVFQRPEFRIIAIRLLYRIYVLG